MSDYEFSDELDAVLKSLFPDAKRNRIEQDEDDADDMQASKEVCVY